MIIRQSKNYTMWGPGVRPESSDVDAKYIITSATDSFGFEDFKEADEKFCKLSRSKSFDSKIIKRI